MKQRKPLVALLFLLLVCVSVSAQVTSQTARRIRSGATLPSTCSPGPSVTDVFIKTGATSPGEYFCSAANTWTGPFGTGASVPYDLAASYEGVPAASATIRIVAPRAFNPVALWVGTICSAGTAATAQTDFLIKVNGTTKATLRFAISGTTCAIVSPTTVSISAADVITIVAPGSADATLADIAISIKGSLP